MAPSTNYYKLLCLLSFTLTVFICVSSTHVLPPESAGGIDKEAWEEDDGLRKMVLGSRPPACMNKCMTCRPCEATLVIPPHKDTHPNYVIHKSSHREDDSYYLLSWKCRCGNRIYQP